MSQPSFDKLYMNLAINMAQQSHCVKQKVGAVITKDNRVVSTGYNGPPRGTYNCDEVFPEVGCPRSQRGGCLFSIHAEKNAILYALKNGMQLKGATLYVTLAPCVYCARLCFLVGIKRVIYLDSYAKYKGLAKEEGEAFFKEFGVTVEVYQEKASE